jgi:hypothetical protein
MEESNMKMINDLTHEELIRLTEQDLQHYIDLEIANDGIKFIQRPELRTPTEVPLLADDLYYEVAGVFYKTQEDAQIASGLQTYHTSYDYNIGYNYKSVESNEVNVITPYRFFKKEALAKVKKTLIDNEEIKVTNKELEEAYKKFEGKIEGCKDKVYSLYSAACTKEREINNAIAAFNRYLELAENNVDIALNFFNKAYIDENISIKEAALIKLGVIKKGEAK